MSKYTFEKHIPKLSTYGIKDLDQRIKRWAERWKWGSSYSIEQKGKGALLTVTLDPAYIETGIASHYEHLEAQHSVLRIVLRVRNKWGSKRVKKL